MVIIEHVLGDPAGLHARLAASIVACAHKFSPCDIGIRFQGVRASATDVFGLMRLDAREGDVLLIYASGEGEKSAAEAIVAVLDGK